MFCIGPDAVLVICIESARRAQCIKNEVATAGPVVSLNQVDAQNAMQNSEQGLQTLLEAPSLDIMADLDFQEDDMWLDLFPGLLTQSWAIILTYAQIIVSFTFLTPRKIQSESLSCHSYWDQLIVSPLLELAVPPQYLLTLLTHSWFLFLQDGTSEVFLTL